MATAHSYLLEVSPTVWNQANEVSFVGRFLAVTTITRCGTVTMIPTTKWLTAISGR
jgi:hypothetical protein